MWLLFRIPKITTLLLLGILLLPGQGFSQQLIQDLQQDWLMYNAEYNGFLPVDLQNLETEIINFSLENDELDPFYLVIGVRDEAHLFYRDKLISTLEPGYTSFAIDSLKEALGSESPFLTIYGHLLLPYLETAIYTSPLPHDSMERYEPVRFANAFSNFVYSVTTLILIFFILLRVWMSEVVEQYLLVPRSLRLKTIDELIYKIPYLRSPNIWFLLFLASLFAYATTIFMYFYPNELHFFGWHPTSASYGKLLLFWGLITVVIFIGIILKYVLTQIVASLFGLSIANIHYASSLRLIVLLGLLLALMGLSQFLFGIQFSENYYWSVLVISLVIIELILYFKLTLVTSYTLLYIIVYLCATEIIPVIFLFKLYTA